MGALLTLSIKETKDIKEELGQVKSFGFRKTQFEDDRETRARGSFSVK